MTGHRVARLSALALLAVAAWPLGATAASAADGQTTVGTTADAWYAIGASGCWSPVGCPPAAVPAPNIYPENTLHVEASLGEETARTYLALDLTQLPTDATLTHGTLTLPLSADNDEGTRAPDTAALRACLVAEVFPDEAEGSTERPPTVDCTISANATFAEMTFKVDLGPFVEAWEAGTPQHGIALVPALTQGTTSSWHLAFDSYRRSGNDVRPITAALAYTTHTQSQVAEPITPGEARSPSIRPPGLAPSLSEPGTRAIPPTAAAQVPSAPPGVLAPRSIVLPADGFRYPAVTLIPLALLIGAIFLAHTFTRVPTPPDATPDGQVAIGRTPFHDAEGVP